MRRDPFLQTPSLGKHHLYCLVPTIRKFELSYFVQFKCKANLTWCRCPTSPTLRSLCGHLREITFSRKTVLLTLALLVLLSETGMPERPLAPPRN
jgi:hypothetical protein